MELFSSRLLLGKAFRASHMKAKACKTFCWWYLRQSGEKFLINNYKIDSKQNKLALSLHIKRFRFSFKGSSFLLKDLWFYRFFKRNKILLKAYLKFSLWGSRKTKYWLNVFIFPVSLSYVTWSCQFCSQRINYVVVGFLELVPIFSLLF